MAPQTDTHCIAQKSILITIVWYVASSKPFTTRAQNAKDRSNNRDRGSEQVEDKEETTSVSMSHP